MHNSMQAALCIKADDDISGNQDMNFEMFILNAKYTEINFHAAPIYQDSFNIFSQITDKFIKSVCQSCLTSS